MNQFSRNVALWLILGLMFLLLFNLFNKQQGQEPDISYRDFVTAVDKGDVTEVTMQGQYIRGKYLNGERFKTYAPDDPDLVQMLRGKDVKISAKPEEGDPWYVMLFVQWFPMLLLIGVWIFFMRQMQVGGGKAMSFGKSRAKLLNENTHKVTFSDVCRHRRGEGRTRGDHRVPQGPQEVHQARRPHPEGRAARRPAGDGEDLAGPRDRRRGRGAVLLDQRLGLRRDVRRRRRLAGARPLRAGQEERAVHHLHR